MKGLRFAVAAIGLTATLLPAWAADPVAKANDQATAGMTKVTGQAYVNNNYGFAVELPAGLTAWMNTPPAPNHGIRIFLGPRRSIEVDADHDGALLGSTAAVADDAIEGQSPDRVSRSVSVLGGLPALTVSLAGPEDRRMVVVAQWTTDRDRLRAVTPAQDTEGNVHLPSSMASRDFSPLKGAAIGMIIPGHTMNNLNDAAGEGSAINVVISLKSTAMTIRQDERVLTSLVKSFHWIHRIP
jgi:hypothetical protein